MVDSLVAQPEPTWRNLRIENERNSLGFFNLNFILVSRDLGRNSNFFLKRAPLVRDQLPFAILRQAEDSCIMKKYLAFVWDSLQ